MLFLLMLCLVESEYVKLISYLFVTFLFEGYAVAYDPYRIICLDILVECININEFQTNENEQQIQMNQQDHFQQQLQENQEQQEQIIQQLQDNQLRQAEANEKIIKAQQDLKRFGTEIVEIEQQLQHSNNVQNIKQMLKEILKNKMKSIEHINHRISHHEGEMRALVATQTALHNTLQLLQQTHHIIIQMQEM